MKILKFLKNSYEWLISILIVFIFFLVFMITHNIRPFGENLFVSSDCLEQVYPFLCVLYDKIHSNESLSYYWNTRLGGNF